MSGDFYVYSYEDWWGYDLTKSSSLKKLINKLERIIRMSPEYYQWTKCVKSFKSSCPKCGTFSDIDPLEAHHTPETLFELVENVLNKRMEEPDFPNKYTPLDIVKEVIELHINDKVNYEILCSSCHKRIHNERKINKTTKLPID